MTPLLTDEELIDLVRDADLDWHAGFPVGEEVNRYATLIDAVEARVIAALAERAGEIPALHPEDHPEPRAFEWTAAEIAWITKRLKAVAVNSYAAGLMERVRRDEALVALAMADRELGLDYVQAHAKEQGNG